MTQSKGLKIAVTGGIGSGKSSVCEFIREEGYFMLSCDQIYSELLQNESFIKKLAAAFGDKIISGGALDRKALSKIVFNDKSKLAVLNGIAHPEIMQEVERRSSGKKICFCEVPLLFENDYERLFDGAVVVLREREQRVLSVCERDKITEKDALLRINSQFNYDNCNFAEYYVIHNDGNLTDLRRKTQELLEKIIK